MPFGLKNSAATFQRVMDSIFRDVPFVFVYLDDILIYSPSEEEHQKHLQTVFQLLHQHSFRLSLDKCEFFKSSINFLGFCITSDGLSPLKEKSSEISDYPLPPDSTALRRFLGMIGYYRRFIPNFADHAFLLSEKAKQIGRAHV